MAFTERYVRADANGSGNGTTDANSGANGSWTLAQAITSVAAGHRVNVKAGTYANTTTSRTFANAGTTTAPIWWRGYRSAIGDLDALEGPRVAGVDLPEFTFTSGVMSWTGAHQWVSHVHVSATSGTQALFQVSGAFNSFRLFHSRVINTSNHASAYALGAGNATPHYVNCYFQAHATATRVVSITVTLNCFIGCIATGGVSGFYPAADAAAMFFYCIGRNNGSYGIELPANIDNIPVVNCTFKNNGSDGIRTGTPGQGVLIQNCLFEGNGGYGLNNASGTNTNHITRIGNAFYGNSSGTENGFGDSPAFGNVIELSPATLSAFNATLCTGALANMRGMPNRFELDDYIGYSDIGAVHRRELPLSPRTRTTRRTY